MTPPFGQANGRDGADRPARFLRAVGGLGPARNPAAASMDRMEHGGLCAFSRARDDLRAISLRRGCGRWHRDQPGGLCGAEAPAKCILIEIRNQPLGTGTNRDVNVSCVVDGIFKPRAKFRGDGLFELFPPPGIHCLTHEPRLD